MARALTVTAAERAAIEQAQAAYCRGLDRFDRANALSAFAPDAVLNYGGIYVGDAPGFMDWVWPFHTGLVLNMHRVANIFIVRNAAGELVSETYVASTLRRREGDDFIDRVGYGRYVDRWTQTATGLAIIEREYLNDAVTEMRSPGGAARAVPPADGVEDFPARRDHGDRSYRLLNDGDAPREESERQ